MARPLRVFNVVHGVSFVVVFLVLLCAWLVGGLVIARWVLADRRERRAQDDRLCALERIVAVDPEPGARPAATGQWWKPRWMWSWCVASLKYCLPAPSRSSGPPTW